MKNLTDRYWLDTYQKFIQEKKLLEGLIRTESLTVSKTKIEDFFQKNKFENYTLEIKDFDMIKISLDFIEIKNKKITFLKNLISLFNLLGYYITRLISNGEIIKTYDLYKIESDRVTFYIAKKFNDIPDSITTLYHITPKFIWEAKILKYGLKPKISTIVTENEEPRIYLLSDLEFAGEFINEKIEQLIKNKKDEIFDVYSWVILHINKNSIQKLYKDPKMENSYYTTEFIPKSGIINVEDYFNN